MTFNELILDYGFMTSDGNLFWKQQSETIFLVIEKKLEDDEGNQRYDFFKLNCKHQEVKYYEKNIIEFFLVRRVVSHFNFLKELERKKKLEPFDGSEAKYLQHLKRKETVKARRNEVVGIVAL